MQAGGHPSDNVAYAVASRSERRSALLVATAAIVIASLVAPIGRFQAAEVTAFLPAVLSASIVAMGLTASLLFAQYRAGGFTPLGILGLAYAATAALLVPYILTFPRIFSPDGILDAGPQSAVWLYVSWHLIFCALVVLYIVVEQAGQRAPFNFGRAATCTAAVVVAVVLACTVGHAWLPHLTDGSRPTPLFRIVAVPALLIAIAAAFGLLVVKTRLRARCHLWLAVVLLALFVEIVMVGYESGGRYSYGWYFARAEFAVVATVFLIMLQMQYMSILRRVSLSNARLEQRNAEAFIFAEVQAHTNRQLADSEARYQVLTDAMPQLVWIVDDASRLKYANARWAAYTGVAPERNAFRDHPIMGDGEQLRDAIAQRLSVPGEIELEARIRRHDGEYRWHLVRAVPFQSSAEATGDWIVTATDIEARLAARDGAAALHEAALAATESKSRFLATMSHEIRTPMNGVIGMTELLLLTPLSAEQQQHLRAVHDSGRSLLRLLDDILDYSKVEAGKLELEDLEFDLSREIDSVEGLMRPQFQNKGVILSSRIAAGVPPKLLGDPGRLRQILINLVGNALKFTSAGGTVGIVVTLDDAIAAGVPIRFSIEDSGIGMAPEVLERLFLPFSQGDGSTTRKYGGTGLGLSICAQLVALMHGTIGVDSVPGTGSSFWFVLPFARAATAQRPARASVAEAHDFRVAASDTANILLVEDNDINTRLAIAQFKQMGFAISVASNGLRGVEAVERGSFDIVFMDCQMPEMDGFAATREIRRLEEGTGRRVAIVAMTAGAHEKDQERCLAAGMDDYLSKPTNLRDLRAVVRRWLPAGGKRAESLGAALG